MPRVSRNYCDNLSQLFLVLHLARSRPQLRRRLGPAWFLRPASSVVGLVVANWLDGNCLRRKTCGTPGWTCSPRLSTAIWSTFRRQEWAAEYRRATRAGFSRIMQDLQSQGQIHLVGADDGGMRIGTSELLP